MSSRRMPTGGSIATFLLGLVCGILFGRLLISVAVWVVCEVRKR